MSVTSGNINVINISKMNALCFKCFLFSSCCVEDILLAECYNDCSYCTLPFDDSDISLDLYLVELCICQARIKKIMQADEEVGKIAMAVPLLVCK